MIFILLFLCMSSICSNGSFFLFSYIPVFNYHLNLSLLPIWDFSSCQFHLAAATPFFVHHLKKHIESFERIFIHKTNYRSSQSFDMAPFSNLSESKSKRNQIATQFIILVSVVYPVSIRNWYCFSLKQSL